MIRNLIVRVHISVLPSEEARIRNREKEERIVSD